MNFVRFAWRALVARERRCRSFTTPPVSVYQNFASLFFLRIALMMRAVPG